MSMNTEQLSILNHTENVKPRKVFCGDGPDMQELVRLGYMQSLGKVSWCPDEYFAITAAGIAALKEASVSPLAVESNAD